MNYYSSFIILVSCIIIVSCAFYKGIKEGLTTSDNIVLFGDSVLNNSKYVNADQSVVDNLKIKTKNVFSFAQDGATIVDCYSQLDTASSDLNTSNTYIFISAGGNDLLNEREPLTPSVISDLFSNYLDFIRSVKVKFPNAKINIFNLYQPANPRYNSYKASIDQWNKLIQDNSGKIGLMYNVLDLHSLLNTPNDFVYDIEPSQEASKKIANLIYLTR